VGKVKLFLVLITGAFWGHAVAQLVEALRSKSEEIAFGRNLVFHALIFYNQWLEQLFN
jgi:hypothetical protein